MCGFLAATLLRVSAADAPHDLKTEGFLGFPQDQATVLCDNKDLRVSVWNDAAYAFIQAVVWADGDDSAGETSDGIKTTDTSYVMIDVEVDGKWTPEVDRTYILDSGPMSGGLNYYFYNASGGVNHTNTDSKGRGFIQYVPVATGKVRVDSFVIPLAEVNRHPGDKLPFLYVTISAKPDLMLNSLGLDDEDLRRRDKFHEMTLANRPASLDPKTIPDNRDALATLKKTPVPEVGTVPPELVTEDWLNTDKPQTLAGLKGKVVVIDFWATWCGPCIAGIPHLNELYEKYGPAGLVILGLTNEGKTAVNKFMRNTPMKYIVGAGSELGPRYGVEGIPHAFVIGRDGKLVWQGHPPDENFDKQIAAALAAP